ncbi:MAG: hypothetical protein RLZZ399_1705 [Verrucomicrobiota bacterium]|jgi:hypothetical protein
MEPLLTRNLLETRRQFFGKSGLRLGSLALAHLWAETRDARADASPGGAGADALHPPLEGLPHWKPKAQSVIYIHLNGGPSQLDLWDYKPGLRARFDQDLPESVRGTQRLTGMTSKQSRFPVAPSIFEFKQHGSCGRWVSELLPYTARVVDDLALIKSVHTSAINHDPACTFVMTGSEIPGRASIGSWLSYGLGSRARDLPSFVVLTPQFPTGSNGQALFSRMWGSGFLPGKHSGVALRGAGDPVLYLQNPAGLPVSERRVMLDALAKLNERQWAESGDPAIQTRIAQYEMAFRMQTSVPELVDLTNEPQSVLDLYGDAVKKSGSFAHSALMARRLVERGVRVVQILHRGWDQHGSLPAQLRNQCLDTDQATAALIQDLKQHGLLESTLVVWGGEFGRTVYSQGNLTQSNYGRDHHPRNFCMWMAGGGIRGGISVGETDDFSYNITEAPVHVHELNATILHCMGIDSQRLSYPFQGLDMRLTGVEAASPVRALLV